MAARNLVRVGEIVEVSAAEALLLVGIKRAEIFKEEEKQPEQTEQTEEEIKTVEAPAPKRKNKKEERNNVSK